MFKVKLAPDSAREQFDNPFIASAWERAPRLRVWTFDAADENEVRRLYNEAKRDNVPNVRGYSLHSIERVRGRDG